MLLDLQVSSNPPRAFPKQTRSTPPWGFKSISNSAALNSSLISYFMLKSFGIALAFAFGFAAQAADWKLVWSDEFDKPGLPDAAKWNYEKGFVRNNELQFYTEKRLENARVESGNLVIEARKERFANPSFRPAASGRPQSRRGAEFADYTSASLTTYGKASWLYGRVEVRAKLPSARGTWPAIWMLGTNIHQVGWPACGEIDIMEFVGHQPGVIHGTIHTQSYNHTKKNSRGSRLAMADVSDKFHVYAMEWDAENIRLFVDDHCYVTCPNDKKGEGSWPFDKAQYLILNLAIGGAWGGQQGVDAESFPQKYLIDYVRIYQKAPASSPK